MMVLSLLRKRDVADQFGIDPESGKAKDEAQMLEVFNQIYQAIEFKKEKLEKEIKKNPD